MKIEEVVCPKCGKRHFKKSGFNDGNGSFFDAFGIGISDCLFRQRPAEEYEEGKLKNPEAFIPNPTKTYFECLECGCKFSVKTTYTLNNQYDEIIDEDKEREARELAWKKAEEERKARAEEAKKEGEKLCCVDYNTIKLSDTLSTTQLVTCLGNGDGSTIDLGGVILKSSKTYTEEQIKNINEFFGWEVKNN